MTGVLAACRRGKQDETARKAVTLVLELLTDREAHLPRQAAQICALMPDAVPGHIAGADGLTPETRPEAVVAAILPFLLAGQGS